MQSTKKIRKEQIEDFISTATQIALDAKQDKPTYVINNNVSGTPPLPRESLRVVLQFKILKNTNIV